jgi:sirohydrochlorin ferrochelatase
VLLTVAHGTRTTAGNDVARELTAAAGHVLGWRPVCTFVELSEPLFQDTAAAMTDPAVVVPLLLSTGYHMRHDVPRAAAASPVPLAVSPPLGPSPVVARLQVDRLRAAGAVPGRDRVVMVAAGSSDPLAAEDLAEAGRLLGHELGRRVEVCVLTGIGPRPHEVVRPGDVVSTYLLAPGHFARRALRECTEAGATIVAGVLGPSSLLVDLVVARAFASAGAGHRYSVAAAGGPPTGAEMSSLCVEPCGIRAGGRR